MDKKIKAIFETRSIWEDAVNDTPIGFAPLAIMLHGIGTLPEINAPLTEAYHPYALISMTTRYTDGKYDGQLGWIHLDSEIKQTLSNLLFDNDMTDQWIYFAQILEPNNG